LAATDVETDVPEAVEEDEVAGLEIAVGDRHAHGPLCAGVVGKRYADLRVDVHHEPGAVEAARARAAPDVRDAEELHRDPDHARVLRRRRSESGAEIECRIVSLRLIARQPRLRLSRERELPRGLHRNEMRDLALDRV